MLEALKRPVHRLQPDDSHMTSRSRYWWRNNRGDHNDYRNLDNLNYMPETRSPSIQSHCHSPSIIEVLRPLDDNIDEELCKAFPDGRSHETSFNTNYDMPENEYDGTLEEAQPRRGSPELMLAQFYGYPPPCPVQMALPPVDNERTGIDCISISPINSEMLEADDNFPERNFNDECNTARTRSPSLTQSTSRMQAHCPVTPLAALVDHGMRPCYVALRTSCCTSRVSCATASMRTEMDCDQQEPSRCNGDLMKTHKTCDVSVQAGKMKKRVKLQGLAKSCARALLGEHVRRAHRHLRALMRLRQLLGRERFDRSNYHSAPVKLSSQPSIRCPSVY